MIAFENLLSFVNNVFCLFLPIFTLPVNLFMKKKKSWKGFIGAFIVTIVVSFLVYECNSELSSRRETLEGIWLIDDLNKKPFIITLSTSHGQKSGATSHLRMIDPETGKILHSQKFERDSWSGDDLKCMTA